MPKLLLADDSITIQRVIELTFSGEDVQVVAVGDGEEAIARIRAERPDIVLADIGMPKRSGYEVAAFVKGDPALAHIPVLLLAGAFEPVDQARADEVKCDGVLVKPFEPQQVIARVRELVDAARTHGLEDDHRTPQPAAHAAETGSRVTPPEKQQPGEPRAAGGNSRPAGQAPRVIESQPIVEVPDLRSPEPTPGVDPGDSLDDYFDRLDAAFASLGNTPPPMTPAPRAAGLDDIAEQTGLPTIDELLGGVAPPSVPGDVPSPGRIAAPPFEPPDAAATLTPSPAREADAAREVDAATEAAPSRPGGAAPTAAELAGTAETSSGNVIADVFSALLAVEQGDPEAARHLPGAHVSPPVNDEIVEAVTRRVLERLAPGAVTDAVSRIVSEIAERLVREEIARIRGNGR